MAITAEQVKELRDKTGAGMMDCKAALDEAGGDVDKAIELLRKKGLARPPSARARREGRHHRPLHPHGRQGRRARRSELRDRLRRAHRRLPDARQGNRDAHRRGRARWCVKREDLPADDAREGEEIYRAQFAGSGQAGERDRQDRRGQARELLRAGRACWISRRCAIPNVTIKQMVAAATAKTGENVDHHAVRPLQARRNRRGISHGKRPPAVAGGRTRPSASAIILDLCPTLPPALTTNESS